jgi:hypothetical protein
MADYDLLISWLRSNDHEFCHEAAAALTAQAGEIKELQQSFDLRWKADMRAIKRWQEANPGKELVWPDHADLCVWLLDQLTAQAGEIERLKEARDECVTAIQFALSIDDHYDMREFLNGWNEGDTSEWPEFRAALAKGGEA